MRHPNIWLMKGVFLKISKKDKVNEYECELSIEDFRALQEGLTVDIDKKIYDKYKHCFEVAKVSKEITSKEVN